MKLYRSDALPGLWIGEDAHGALVQWPARERGWLDRTPYTGPRRALEEVPVAQARGSGWPGAGAGRPPRDGAAATKKITIRVTDEEHAAYRDAADGAPLADWARRELNEAAAKAK